MVPARPSLGLLPLRRALGVLRESVARPLRLGGLVAQFAISITVWLALWAVVPALLPSWTSVVITSGSMAPALRPGDVVVAIPPDGEVLGEGAVVVFSDRHRPGLITHRVVAVNPDGTYVTQGDANPSSDSTPLTAEQVVGLPRLRVPYVGLPIAWLESGDWALLGLWLIGTIVMLWLARFGDSPRGMADGKS